MLQKIRFLRSSVSKSILAIFAFTLSVHLFSRTLSSVISYKQLRLDIMLARNSSNTETVTALLPSSLTEIAQSADQISYSTEAVDAYNQMATPPRLVRHMDSKKVFVFDGYLIDNNSIRVITIKKCGSTKELLLHVGSGDNAISVPLDAEIILNCPWFFAPKCDFVGYFAIGKTDPDQSFTDAFTEDDESTVSVSSWDLPGIRYKIRLHDVRPKSSEHKHVLGVCLPPIFLLADWTIIIQFFEIWIAQGATKFYIYVQSVSPEVDAVLKVYEADENISVERVDWGLLPSGFNMVQSDDANHLVFTTEVASATNDCVLRSRHNVKYVISSDLDEMAVSLKNYSLIEMLDKFLEENPSAASFLIRNSYAYFKNEWINVTDPKSLNFSIFANISVEKYVWPAGQRSKVVMLPERIRSTHVHDILRTEDNMKGITVSPEDVIIYHLRRLPRHFGNNHLHTDFSNALAEFIPLCEANWSKRLKLVENIKGTEILRGETWPNRGFKVMKELEQCMDADFEHRYKHCPAVQNCVSGVQSVKKEEWIYAKQNWAVV